VLLMRGEQGAARVTRTVARRVPFLDEESAERFVLRVATRLQTLVADRRRLVRGVAWDLAFWLCSAASLWVFLAAFGYRAGLDGLIVAFALAYVLAAIPITPAGLGVVEATMIALLTFFGADRGTATLGVVSYRLINFWLPIPLGALAYLSLQVEQGTTERRKAAELRRLAERSLREAEEHRVHLGRREQAPEP
jgi:uncharacterized protein (TIRG00374 family)